MLVAIYDVINEKVTASVINNNHDIIEGLLKQHHDNNLYDVIMISDR